MVEKPKVPPFHPTSSASKSKDGSAVSRVARYKNHRRITANHDILRAGVSKLHRRVALPQKAKKKFVSFTTSLHIMSPSTVSFQPGWSKNRYPFFPLFPAYHDGLAIKNRAVPLRTPTATCRLGVAASRLLGVLAVVFQVPVVGMRAVEALLTSELWWTCHFPPCFQNLKSRLNPKKPNPLGKL